VLGLGAEDIDLPRVTSGLVGDQRSPIEDVKLTQYDTIGEYKRYPTLLTVVWLKGSPSDGRNPSTI
jgi:hypothetical protein